MFMRAGLRASAVLKSSANARFPASSLRRAASAFWGGFRPGVLKANLYITSPHHVMSDGSSSRLTGVMLPRANRFRGHVHRESQQACSLPITSLKTNTQRLDEQSVSSASHLYPKKIDTFHLSNADELTTVLGQAEMQWGNWYALRSDVRASLWIAPVLTSLLQTSALCGSQSNSNPVCLGSKMATRYVGNAGSDASHYRLDDVLHDISSDRCWWRSRSLVVS